MKYDYQKIRKQHLKERKKRLKYLIKKFNKEISCAVKNPDAVYICIGSLDLLTEEERNYLLNFYREKGFLIFDNDYEKYFISWEEKTSNDVE